MPKRRLSCRAQPRLGRNPSADDRRIRHAAIMLASPCSSSPSSPSPPQLSRARPSSTRCSPPTAPSRPAPPRRRRAADGFAPMFDAEVVMPSGGQHRARPRRRDRRLPRQPRLPRGPSHLDASARRHLGRRHPGLHLRLPHPLGRRSRAARAQISRLLGAPARRLAGRRLPPAPPPRRRGLDSRCCRPRSRLAAARAATRPAPPRTSAASQPPSAPFPTAPSRSACARPSANMAARTR